MIVTSDHGIGYVWYEEQPAVDLFTKRAGEVYYVPLFVKKPGQDRGELDAEPSVTVDIFPTIAEIMNMPISWSVDGFSATGQRREREARRGTGNFDTRATWLPDGNPDFSALKEKIALFGQRNLRDLYYFGPHKDLVGRDVGTIPLSSDIRSAGNVVVEMELGKRRPTPSVPFYLKGELMSVNSAFPPEGLTLAIAVNGVIRGTTQPTVKDGRITFIVRIPPQSWRGSDDLVDVFAVVNDVNAGKIALVRFTEVGAD